MTEVPVIIVALGALVLVLCALSVLRLRDPYDRLHVSTPATSVAGVLICAGLALHDRTFHDVAKLIVIGLVLLLTGPAAAVASARAERTRQTQSAKAAKRR